MNINPFLLCSGGLPRVYTVLRLYMYICINVQDLTGGEGATWAVSKQATDLSKPIIIHLPPHF